MYTVEIFCFVQPWRYSLSVAEERFKDIPPRSREREHLVQITRIILKGIVNICWCDNIEFVTENVSINWEYWFMWCTLSK